MKKWKNYVKYTSFLLSLLLCFLSTAGCSNKEPISKTGFYFDTVITITLYDNAQADLLDQCFALAHRYELLFSTTIEESDISRINASAGEPVTVSHETIELLQQGISYGDISGGRFDITIGALSSLWNFSDNSGVVPEDENIQEALQTVDYHSIRIDGNTVTLLNPDTRIDLGGIAKGYIADHMKTYLCEHGVTSGIINLGGNVLVIGAKTDGSAYTIGIQKPFEDTGSAIASLKITDQSVVSSGVYERYFETDDTLYHHILDPQTGYPYNNHLLGVSIICDSSVDGDALSTTAFSMGLFQGMAFIESLPDTEAIFITDDYALHTTSGITEDMLKVY
ncbi:MAG: FAD:protein FMN transferase [Roseburia sp.]